MEGTITEIPYIDWYQTKHTVTMKFAWNPDGQRSVIELLDDAKVIWNRNRWSMSITTAGERGQYSGSSEKKF